jgi:hypothetical protein
VSEAGQPLLVPQPSTPLPAFADDPEQHFSPQVQQPIDRSREESHQSTPDGNGPGGSGSDGSGGSVSDGDGSGGSGSGGGGFYYEELGPVESSQPAATYGLKTGLQGNWAKWWAGGYTEKRDSHDPPQTTSFCGPANRPSAFELRGRLPGNVGAKSINVTLEDAEGVLCCSAHPRL